MGLAEAYNAMHARENELRKVENALNEILSEAIGEDVRISQVRMPAPSITIMIEIALQPHVDAHDVHRVIEAHADLKKVSKKLSNKLGFEIRAFPFYDGSEMEPEIRLNVRDPKSIEALMASIEARVAEPDGRSKHKKPNNGAHQKKHDRA